MKRRAFLKTLPAITALASAASAWGTGFPARSVAETRTNRQRHGERTSSLEDQSERHPDGTGDESRRGGRFAG